MPETKVRMRAPNGETAMVPPNMVDFFRKNGAVLLGPDPSQSPASAGPPAPAPPETEAQRIGFNRQQMLSNMPPDVRMPVEPRVQEPTFRSSNARDASGAPVVLPPEPMLSRMLSGAATNQPDSELARRLAPPPPGPTAMRAPTWSEKANAMMGDVQQRISEQPLIRMTDAIGASDFAGAARRARGEEPMPEVMGAMPDLPGGGWSKKLANKAWRETLETVFPKFDAYNKKINTFLKPEKFVARLEAHPDVPPDLLDAARKYAASRKGKPVSNTEIADVLSGTKHERGRVLYDMSRVKGTPLPGAPLWVTNKTKEAEALERYLDAVRQGAQGRRFYIESGEAFKRITGDDPVKAHRLGRAASATSSGTSVGANAGFAFKGNNQMAAGMPVETGRWPERMGESIRETYEGNIDEMGPKHDPFARQIAMGGGYATPEMRTRRAVHDIWEGEAFGYVNPDGTPARMGFNDAQHAWMDSLVEKAIKHANDNKLGGFDDWDAGNLQAAAWTGAKIKAGTLKPGDAAKSFADFIKPNTMQTGREIVPGSSQQHLVGLEKNPAALAYYDNAMADALYDKQGRDILGLDLGLLSDGSLEGPGIFEAQVTPGRQVKTVAGTVGDPKVVDDASMKAIQANEALYALVAAQDAIAGTMPNPKALAAARNMYDMKLPGNQPLGMADPALDQPGFARDIAATRIAMMPEDEGVRILNLDQLAREPGVPKSRYARRQSMKNVAEQGRSRTPAPPVLPPQPLTQAQAEEARRVAALSASETPKRLGAIREKVSSELFDKSMRKQSVDMGTGGKKGALEVEPSQNLGFYQGKRADEAGSLGAMAKFWADLIREIPTGAAHVDKPSVRARIAMVNTAQYHLRDHFGIGLNDARMEMQEALAKDGMKGLRAFAMKYGVALSAAIALAHSLGLRPPSQPEASQ